MGILNSIGSIASSAAQGIGSLFGMGQSPVKPLQNEAFQNEQSNNNPEQIGEHFADEVAQHSQADNPSQNPNYVKPTAPIDTPTPSPALQATQQKEKPTKAQGIFDTISQMGQESLNGNHGNHGNPDDKSAQYNKAEEQFNQLPAVQQRHQQQHQQPYQQQYQQPYQQQYPNLQENSFGRFNTSLAPLALEYSPNFLQRPNPFLNGGMTGGMNGGMNGGGGWNPLQQLVNPTPILDYFQSTFYPQLSMGANPSSFLGFNNTQRWGFDSQDLFGLNQMAGVFQDPMGSSGIGGNWGGMGNWGSMGQMPFMPFF